MTPQEAKKILQQWENDEGKVKNILQAQKVIDAETLMPLWEIKRKEIAERGQRHLRSVDVEEFIKEAQKSILNQK